jgi:hypothetical protein
MSSSKAKLETRMEKYALVKSSIKDMESNMKHMSYKELLTIRSETTKIVDKWIEVRLKQHNANSKGVYERGLTGRRIVAAT